MTDSQLVIGLSGCKKVGKDTLGLLLHDLIPTAMLYTFARALKEDLDPFLLQHTGISAFTDEPAQKEMIRHSLIGYGMTQRARNPNHWIETVIDQIEAGRANGPLVAIVTDFRFPNECRLFRERYGKSFVQIDVTRVGAPKPTDEELKHFAEVAAMADWHLHWGNDTLAQQQVRAQEVVGWLALSAPPASLLQDSLLQITELLREGGV